MTHLIYKYLYSGLASLGNEDLSHTKGNSAKN